MAGEVVSPARSRSSSFTRPVSWVPFCHPQCPPVVPESCDVASPSVLDFPDRRDDVVDASLVPDPVVSPSVAKGDAQHDSLHLALGDRQNVRCGLIECPRLAAIRHHWHDVLIEDLPLDLHGGSGAPHDVVHLAEGDPAEHNPSLYLRKYISILRQHAAQVNIAVYLLDDLSVHRDWGRGDMAVEHDLGLT